MPGQLSSAVTLSSNSSDELSHVGRRCPGWLRTGAVAGGGVGLSGSAGLGAQLTQVLERVVGGRETAGRRAGPLACSYLRRHLHYTKIRI